MWLTGVDSLLVCDGIDEKLLRWLDVDAEAGKLFCEAVASGPLGAECGLEPFTALCDIVLLLLKPLGLVALSLARCLSSTTIAEDALDSALLLLSVGLCTFSSTDVSNETKSVAGWKIYLGGRCVVGSGNCWPHDLRFLTSFLA